MEMDFYFNIQFCLVFFPEHEAKGFQNTPTFLHISEIDGAAPYPNIKENNRSLALRPVIRSA